MPVALYNNNTPPVLSSPFSNSLGGITSKYESRGGARKSRKSRRGGKKSKKTRKTRKSRKARK